MRRTRRSGTKLVRLMTAAAVTTAFIVPAQLEAQCGAGGVGGRRIIQPRINVAYDRSEDLTRTTLAPYGDTRFFAIGAVYECPGNRPCAPGAVQLMLVAVAPTAQYETSNEITITLPGAEPMSFTPQYTGRRDRNEGFCETLAWTMGNVEFLALAGAERVELQAGANRGQLTADQRRARALLAARIREVPQQ